MPSRRREPASPDREQAPLPGLDELDRLLEHRVRLALCVLLGRHDALTFRRLKQATGETDGSLGAQLAKLEQAGYVSVEKTFEDRKPTSWYRLERAGRRALGQHLQALEKLLGSPLKRAARR